MRQPVIRAEPDPIRVPAPVMAWPQLSGWLLAGLLALVTIALYWPAMQCDFVDFDDDLYVTANAHVQSGLTLENIGWAFSNLELGFWHPLTWLSILADGQFYGMRAWGHHLTSVLLHAASTGLLFLALQRMTGAKWRSAVVAGLFGWHPLHVESVAWASERKEVLSGFFWMLTLVTYARYAECRMHKPATPTTRDAPRFLFQVSHFTFHALKFYGLTLFFFVLGLMSKPMVVTLPLMLLLLDWWPLQRFRLNTPGPKLKQMVPLIWEKVPFLVAAFVFGVVTIYAERGVGALGSTTQYPLAGRVQNALLSYLIYLRQTFWPADLTVFYPYPKVFPAWRAAGAGGVGLLLSALLLRAPRKWPYLAAGWVWYLVTLLPVIGLIRVGDFSRADRFMYVPVIGAFLALSWGTYELTRRWRYQVLALSAAGGAAIVMCLALTRQQIGYWKDGEALFRHVLGITDNNPIAHNNLGIALVPKGQLGEAIRQYQEALRLKPDYADAYNNLGNALGLQGQTDEAIRQFQEALRLKPDYADAHKNLGIALFTKGQLDEAIGQFQEAVHFKPDYAQAHNYLGSAFGLKGQLDEAVRQFQEAVRLKPDYAEAYNGLGTALAKKGQFDEALSQFQEAVRLKPDYVEARNNLGVALSNKGQTDEAMQQFQEALRLKPDYAEASKNLDAVRAAVAHASPPSDTSTNR